MHSPATFLFAIILALSIAPAPQAQEKSPPREKKGCGTVIPPEQIDAELASMAESALKNSAPSAITPPPADPYYLPMTIHIVHKSDGTGGFSLKQLNEAMLDLNRLWRQVGVQFFIHGNIDHILSDTHHYIPNDPAKRDALRTVNVVPNTINVYFTYLEGFCGEATLTGNNVQGVLMDNACTGSLWDPSTFAHEIGHYFNLYHTHEPRFGLECPSGINGSTAGDLMDDTAADPDQSIWRGLYPKPCGYYEPVPTPAGCDTTPYNPPTGNLMSYAENLCRLEFTPKQISRILETLRNADNRKNLINSGTRYVDQMANASNIKCTYGAPCRTMEKAVQAANNGDLIVIKHGAYWAPSFGNKRLTLNKWGLEPNTGALLVP